MVFPSLDVDLNPRSFFETSVNGALKKEHTGPLPDRKSGSYVNDHQLKVFQLKEARLREEPC